MSTLPLQFLILSVAGWVTRSQESKVRYLMAENGVLREQVGRKRLRYTDAQRRRLAVAAKHLGRKVLAQMDTLVTPHTLLGWYRELVAKKYDGSSRRGPGRPRTRVDVAELVLRMARENGGWGYTRIRGALSNLGHDVGRNTIKRILLDAGMDPAPDRSKRTSWSAFLRAHWGAIAAMDFFMVEVLTLGGLVRLELTRFRGHLSACARQRDHDAETRKTYAPEFREQMNRAAKSGRSVESLAREFGVSGQTVVLIT